MEKYLNELRKIDREIFINKVSQKTIDILQEINEQLDRDLKSEPIYSEELGAINYEIDILLEIWDKELEYDIKILKKVDKIISDWYKNI